MGTCQAKPAVAKPEAAPPADVPALGVDEAGKEVPAPGVDGEEVCPIVAAKDFPPPPAGGKKGMPLDEAQVECFCSPLRLLGLQKHLNVPAGVPWNADKGEFEWEGYEFAKHGYQYELKMDEGSLIVDVKELLIEKVWGSESLTFRLLPDGLIAFGEEPEGFLPEKGLFERWRYDPRTDQMEFVYWLARGNGVSSLEDAYDDDLSQAIGETQLENARAWKLGSRKSTLSGGRATGFKEWTYVNRWEGGNIPGKMIRVNTD